MDENVVYARMELDGFVLLPLKTGAGVGLVLMMGMGMGMVIIIFIKEATMGTVVQLHHDQHTCVCGWCRWYLSR